VKLPTAWMRRPTFRQSRDGVSRCTVRASTRIDEATFEDLNRRLSFDREFKTREAGMDYILSLGISAYLSSDEAPDPTGAQSRDRIES
jgi:hypothetical protein